MSKESLIFIEHIMENIKDIEQFSKGLSKGNLEKNKLKQKAIIRSLEVIGEAVKNLPIALRAKYPGINWRAIAGLRDKLIHSYFGIDINTIWSVIKDDLPILKKEVSKIKEDLEKGKTH